MDRERSHQKLHLFFINVSFTAVEGMRHLLF